MIRFNCPTCGRPYELPDAMAHLPLVCKQCGQRLTPPAPTPDPPPPPPPPPKPVPPPPAPVPVAAPKPPAPLPPKPVAAKLPPAPAPKPKPPLPDDDSLHDDDVLVTKADSTPDIDFNVGGPLATSLSDAARARPAGLSDANRPRPTGLEATEPDINLDLLPPAPPAPPPRPVPPPAPAAPPARTEPTLAPFVADLAAFVLLVVAGMFFGEMLAGKPTGQVLSEAGSAAKFPPVDLMLWAAPPVLFGLVYLLLGSRERSVGAWLRRRQSR